MVTVPIALKATGGVIRTLALEELGETWVTAARLFSRRPPVICQVVAAVLFDGAIDEHAEMVGCRGDASGRVFDMQVEDDARQGSRAHASTVSSSRSRSNRAVDDVETKPMASPRTAIMNSGRRASGT